MGQFWFSKNNLTMANKIVAANKDLGNNGLNGGIFKGKRHHEGGIAVEVQGGGKVEVETDEPIIVPEAVNANTKVSFDGKKMTPKEVISKINTDYGGVPIKKKGGFVDVKAEIKRLKDIKERGGNIEQPIKVKAGSVVVTRGAILNDEKHEYNGEMLTNKEILSKINHDIGGGVEFAEGGKIEEDCGCNHTMQNGGLIDALELSKENLNTNGLVLKSHDKSIIVLAYNTGGQEFNPSLYNLRLIRDVVAKIDNLKSNELVSIFVNQVSLDRFDEKKLDEYKKAKHLIICNQNEVVYNSNDNFESGGLIPQQGTLYTKDKTCKLEYQKKGNDYVFKVYDFDYTRNQYKKRGDNEAIMNYKQFINYLYAELYIDDKLEQGGEIGNPNENFIKWFVEWFKDGVSEVMNITISIPILDYDFGIKAKKNEILILDLFEKIDQNIDAKPYLKKICEKADYYGVYFLCEPMPRYKYLLTNIEKRKKISVEYLINYYKSFGFKNIEGKKFMVREPKNKFEKGGEINQEETYKKWKSLVNMSKGELENFYNSEEGKKAGLSSSKANQLGIHSGRESARWIMKMKDTPHQEWTPTMWDWANRQISFISRMSGNKGGLYDDKGNKTRKHTSLLIWGHNPKKFESGGQIYLPKYADKSYNIELAKKLVSDLGLELQFTAYSDTNGISVYFEDKNGLKYRVSDHSVTSKSRIDNEILLYFDERLMGFRGSEPTIKSKYQSNLDVINKFEGGGNLIKRADGTYSKHGLWDSIRENAGSGRKPTKEMLEQEEKIKANSMANGGEFGINKNPNKINYRIVTEDYRIKYAGTGHDSWFTLDKARKLVDYSKGEMIYEYNYNGDMMWEVFENGGELKKEDVMLCENCGWTWKVADSTTIDKYICYGCGHNNYKKSN